MSKYLKEQCKKYFMLMLRDIFFQIKNKKVKKYH